MEEVIRNPLNCLDPDLSIPTQISSNLKKKVTKFMRSKRFNTCRILEEFYVKKSFEIALNVVARPLIGKL